MRGSLALTFVSALTLAACGGSDGGSSSTERSQSLAAPAADAAIAALAVPAGATSAARVDRRLQAARGEIEVWVQLAEPSVAAKRRELAPAAALRSRDAALRSALAAHRQLVREQQGRVVAALASLGARELARVQVAHNAIAVKVDARRIQEIAALPGVVKVRPVVTYSLDLAETVPYVGAAAVQTAGVDGSGVKVAVLDSGIDYTHANLGGAGTGAAYAAAYGAAPGDAAQTTTDGLFPTVKVVNGYDFVGEAWPNGDRSEDPDPIDFQGHGSHVADIIAGRSNDGAHKGVAPGASLVAVKVCSAVATSCNGVALLKGMDFAIDPNGDSDFSDAVDVVNMSLGSNYGQEEDDLTLAATEAVKLGVVVVASAGNGGNKPYVTGSPGMGAGVLSVAQTSVPSAGAIPLVVNAPAAVAGTYTNTNTVDWAPIDRSVTNDVVVAGLVCAEGSVPATVAGKVALVDRGSCNISEKVDRAARAGAAAVILANNAAGDAPTFSFGGGTVFVPTIVIQNTLGAALKAAAASATVNVTISPDIRISLVGSMASTSSRGPDVSRSGIKPEIGAPGASLSAEVGTGTGQTAFGGTSGAAPMVAGAAALLRQAHPTRSPAQIKAMLMNAARTEVFNNNATQPGVLAPISRIGAGELRVDRAIGLNAIVRNPAAASASLPFGYAEVRGSATLVQDLVVENFSNTARTYAVSPSFRYANDAASAAVVVEAPGSVSVPARGSVKLRVKLLVDGSKLPTWNLNGGSQGGNGALLEGVEYDGYLTLAGGGETLSVPWHALLRKAAATRVARTAPVKPGQAFALVNNGVEAGAFDVFALTGSSPRDFAESSFGPGSNLPLIDLKAVGVRAVNVGGGATSGLQFAISAWTKRAHPLYPGGYEVQIDGNNDGTADFAVYQSELSGFGASGQSVVNVLNLATGASAIYFYNDADLQSGNSIFTVPTAAVGISDPTQPFTFTVLAYDNYFTGTVTDAIEGMRFTAATPRFVVAGDTSPIAAGGTRQLAATPVAGGAAASPSQRGLLLMYRRNAGSESDAVLVQ
ncbi:MAG TPA: S8 family serine peptidase [Methylibium sp.]|nr:S8 family serine peptidase [Methylibium sp.]